MQRGACWALGACLLAAACACAGAWAAGGFPCDAMPLCVDPSQCVYDEDSVQCPNGTVRHTGGAAFCGCCPSCVEPIGAGKNCTHGSIPCSQNYTCSRENNTCVQGPCVRAEDHEQWQRRCDFDGTFAPAQCKGGRGAGEGGRRCFCWSPDGRRLDGEGTSEDMPCACSLLAWEREGEGEGHRAPHCDEQGNFEVLQCDEGVCWCANSTTGAPLSLVVPEATMTMLECYSAEAVGAQWRRQCDSGKWAVAEIRKLYRAHNHTALQLPEYNCDLDGGYGPVQTSDTDLQFCAKKDKLPIKSYGNAFGMKMDCNCARDEVQMNRDLRCESHTGNYPEGREEGDLKYCLDADGFLMKFVDNITDCTRPMGRE